MTRKQQIKLAAIDVYGTINCRAAEHFVAGAMWSDANPGLKESEDERVRKALIEMIHDTTGDECEDCYHVSKESVLAWLEKQQSFDKDKLAKGFLRSVATSIMNWLDANTSEGKMCLSNMECEDIENAVRNADWSKVYAYMRKKLEKQGEQKTLDADEVIDWLKTKVYDDSTYGMAMIDQFKKDFGL